MKTEKVKWGVLGVAAIAVKKVIPAMQKGEWSEIAALASRDSRKAQDAAHQLGIPKSYGSYEELLADPEIEAVYNRSRIIYTFRGPSKRPKQGSTSYAKNP